MSEGNLFECLEQARQMDWKGLCCNHIAMLFHNLVSFRNLPILTNMFFFYYNVAIFDILEVFKYLLQLSVILTFLNYILKQSSGDCSALLSVPQPGQETYTSNFDYGFDQYFYYTYSVITHSA